MIIVLAFIVAMYCIFLSLLRRQSKTLDEIIHPGWYEGTQFPYHAFPPCKHVQRYRELVKEGEAVAKSKTIVFVGCCINIARSFHKLKERMYDLGSRFKDWRFVVFENDSKDGTRERLMHWSASDPRVHLVPCAEQPQCLIKGGKAWAYGDSDVSARRLKYMTEFRNRARDYAVAEFSDFDYACVMDLDLSGPIAVEGMLYGFGLHQEWDAMFAYGMASQSLPGFYHYYDNFPYSDKDIPRAKSNPSLLLWKFLNVPRGHDTMIPVFSAFAGMGIYEMSAFGDPRVSYTPPNGVYDQCEHLVLNRNIAEVTGKDRFYLNPNMMILVGAQGNGGVIH